VNHRTAIGFLLLALVVTGTGCSRASWNRADVFSANEAARSQRVVAATIESIAFLGGVQRGVNLHLDEAVATDQGTTKRIYLEQPVQLPTGIMLMKRVRVHFDQAGSPLYLEELKPAAP
jgi:hypothetical protein